MANADPTKIEKCSPSAFAASINLMTPGETAAYLHVTPSTV
jgi:hypothetical protein